MPGALIVCKHDNVLSVIFFRVTMFLFVQLLDSDLFRRSRSWYCATLLITNICFTWFCHFSFQVCSKCFSTSGSLKIHTRLHTGARPFKCTQCDMRFRTTGHRHLHLQSHMRGTARKKAPKPRKNIIRMWV